MLKKSSLRFKIIAFLLCVMLLVAGFVPAMNVLRPKADGEDPIYVYFDTGACSADDYHDDKGFGKNMTVYYMLTTEGDTVYQETKIGGDGIWIKMEYMENIPSVYDPVNGKVWRAQVAASEANKQISFTGYGNGAQNKMYRTGRRGISLYEGIRFYDNGSDFNGYRGVWSEVTKKIPRVPDYSGSPFAMANFTDSDATFTLHYYTNDNGTEVNPKNVSVTVNARTLNEEMTIESSGTGNTPYTHMKVYDSNNVLLKTYDLTNNKIPGASPGNCFVYGITTYHDTNNSYNEGDHMNVCFYHQGRYTSLPAVSGEYLYFSNKLFSQSDTFTVKINGTTNVPVKKVLKEGNASWMTENPLTLSAGDIISVIKSNGDVFRMLWTDTSSNLVIVSTDTLRISGKYTVQTDDATLTETGDDGVVRTYTYRTVQADFYDYQYDGYDSDNFTYNYRTYCDEKNYIYFQDKHGWGNNIRVYFFNSSDNTWYAPWPGLPMRDCNVKHDNHEIYAAEVPAGFNKVIFSNGGSPQTVDLNVSNNQTYWIGSSVINDNSANNGKYNGGTFNSNFRSNLKNTISDSTASVKGAAKRPYLAINEAISASTYATWNNGNNYPMYLGQFWLPLMDNDTTRDESSEIYNSNTTGQKAGHNDDGDNYYVSNGYDGYYGFGNTLNNFKWGANLAFRYSDQAAGTYEPYNAVVQGLVGSELNADGKLVSQGGQVIPYFDKSWWTQDGRDNFTDSQGHTGLNMGNYIRDYEGYDFPFYVTDPQNIHFKNVEHNGNLISDNDTQYEGKYYVFDSTKNVVRFEEDATTHETVLQKYYDKPSQRVLDNYGTDGSSQMGHDIGMFPFNQPSDGNGNGNALHYGFGVKFSIDFYLPEYGTVDGEENGTPLTFTFQGDDDVWVFLDDKLLLDMGGAHKNSIGEINFSNKTVYIGSKEDKSASVAVSSAPLESSTPFSGLGFTADDLKIGKHKITMFYLERGMLNSNLYVMFNLPTNISHLEVQEDTDFTRVNDGFQSVTKKVANRDVFNYTIENKATDPNAEDMDSHFNYPTYGAETRENDEVNVNTVLSRSDSARSPGTTTQRVDLPTDRIYLVPNSDWLSGNAAFGAVFTDSTDSSKVCYVPAYKEVGTDRYYVVRKAGYDKIKWLRFNPTYQIRYETPYEPPTYFYNDSSKPKVVWNKTGSIGISNEKNKMTITGWTTAAWVSSPSDNFSTYYDKTVSDYSGIYETHNFKPGNDDSLYDPVVDNNDGVTYKLTDKFADGTVIYNTRSYGSGSENVVSLQYAEMATFRKQFTMGSMMRVTQMDELSAPPASGNRDQNGYDDTGTRLVSDYYDTYLKSTDLADVPYAKYAGMYDVDSFTQKVDFDHVDEMYGDNSITNNYSVDDILNFQVTGTQAEYNFQDPSDATNNCLHLRQVYVNAVRTGDLTIKKQVNSADADPDDEFTFHISFQNVFGGENSDVPADIASVAYYKNGDLKKSYFGAGGEFKLKANEYIQVKGVPVGTKYTVTEAAKTGYQITDGETVIDLTELLDDNEEIIVNAIKNGSVEIQKLAYDEGTGALMTTVDKEFPIVVNVTLPTGKDVRNYPLSAKWNGASLPGSKFDVEFDGSDTRKATITAYIKPNSSAGGSKKLVISGFPYNTTYTVSEDTANMPASYAAATTMPTASVFTNTTYNASYTSGDPYSNIFYSRATHTIGDNTELVTVENVMQPIVMPTTGGSGIIFIFPIGIIAVALSGGAFVIYRRRLTAAARAERSER